MTVKGETRRGACKTRPFLQWAYTAVRSTLKIPGGKYENGDKWCKNDEICLKCRHGGTEGQITTSSWCKATIYSHKTHVFCSGGMMMKDVTQVLVYFHCVAFYFILDHSSVLLFFYFTTLYLFHILAAY